MPKSIIGSKFAIVRQRTLASAHRAALRVRMVDAPEVRAILNLFPRALRKDVHIDVSDYNPTNLLTFSVYLRDLDSLKDKRLARTLMPFLAEEWESHTNDYTYDTPNRDYRFNKKIEIKRPTNEHTRWLVSHAYMPYGEGTMPVEIQIFISAYVKADSDSCRIEVVERKEKIVIEEVKRIVCA